MKNRKRGAHALSALATAAAALATVGVAACWSQAPTADPGAGDRQASGHSLQWMNRGSPEFHGKVVREAGFDFTKAKWTGVSCSRCHSPSDAAGPGGKPGAPSCSACHSSGPAGTPGHPPGWMHPASSAFHGKVVKDANYDYKQAKADGTPCSTCHAGDNPTSQSPVYGATSCYACHAGGPDGSAAHPQGYASPASPVFHGLAVREAGYDYTKAKVGNLSCSACHAGERRDQASWNSRAPSCFSCHLGGPTGSAGHPIGFGTPGAIVYASRIRTCASCHSDAQSDEPGSLGVNITLRGKE